MRTSGHSIVNSFVLNTCAPPGIHQDYHGKQIRYHKDPMQQFYTANFDARVLLLSSLCAEAIAIRNGVAAKISCIHCTHHFHSFFCKSSPARSIVVYDGTLSGGSRLRGHCMSANVLT